ncbi:MAG: purine-nucleoside phosphorylase [Streptosporangiales bacterium]|nr:purine-nucleoside phosphorylase [Streptosporangiales bacterium]
MNNDAYPKAQQAAESLRSKTGADGYDVALVMGSGWVDAADALGEPDHEFAVTDLPGFTPPAVEGHAGRIRALPFGGKRVLVLLGRTHLYEGHGPDAVVHGVRTAIAAGVSTVVLTNAAGSLRADFQVGQPILISDHLNLTGASPLTGPSFVDLTDAYDPHVRDLARMADPSLAQGVYAQLRGPQYETPAEIRMLRTMGADLVGMSTTLETIAVREGGARVLGISLVTNVAAGLGGDPLDHEEVLEAGRASAAHLGDLLYKIVDHL